MVIILSPSNHLREYFQLMTGAVIQPSLQELSITEIDEDRTGVWEVVGTLIPVTLLIIYSVDNLSRMVMFSLSLCWLEHSILIVRVNFLFFYIVLSVCKIYFFLCSALLFYEYLVLQLHQSFLIQMYSDAAMNIGNDVFAEFHTRDSLFGKNVYMYQLDHRGEHTFGDMLKKETIVDESKCTNELSVMNNILLQMKANVKRNSFS